MSDQSQTAEAKITDADRRPYARPDAADWPNSGCAMRIYFQSDIDWRDAEIERLRYFAQWVADHSNDPAVVHQAVLHGADLAKEQAR